MPTPATLSKKLGGDFSGVYSGSGALYSKAMAALVIALGDDELEASSLWFDSGPLPNADMTAETGMHVRLLSPAGVLTLDQDFSDTGAPIARLVPWSRVEALQVVARHEVDDTAHATNAWLDTADGLVEFAGEGHRPVDFEAIIASARKHLR